MRKKVQLENNSACWALEMRFQQIPVPWCTQEKSTAQEPGIDWGLSPPCPFSAEPLATGNPITVKQRFTSVPRGKLWTMFCLKTVLSTCAWVRSQDLLKVLMSRCTLSWSRILANPDISVHLDQAFYSCRGRVGHTLSACFLLRLA